MDVNSTEFLLGAYGVIDRPRGFLLDTFFPQTITFDTEKVYFDRIERSRRLAPFVSPLVEGKVMRHRGYETLSFEPPYLKPKHAITPNLLLKRRPGEDLSGSLSPAQREVLVRGELLRQQDEDITRREEWMASTMLRTGSVTCVGDEHPAVVVDMQRTNGHTVQLLTTARWGESGVEPYDDLKTWAETVQNASGYHPRMVIVDPKAGALLGASTKLQEERKIFNGPRSSIDNLGRTAGGLGDEVKFLGETPEFEIWQYQQLYADSAGAVQKMMPDHTVIMGSPAGAAGTRLYAAIQDLEMFMALSRYPKSWVEKDPSVRYLMTQSAPVMALGWADATLCATVR